MSITSLQILIFTHNNIYTKQISMPDNHEIVKIPSYPEILLETFPLANVTQIVVRIYIGYCTEFV